MNTLYFRHPPNGHSTLLFTSAESPTRPVEELMLQEIQSKVKEPGVYKAEMSSENDGFPRSLSLIKIADHEQSVAMVHLQTTESGQVIVETARLEHGQQHKPEEAMKLLASVAARQAQQLPPNSDEWVFFAL